MLLKGAPGGCNNLKGFENQFIYRFVMLNLAILYSREGQILVYIWVDGKYIQSFHLSLIARCVQRNKVNFHIVFHDTYQLKQQRSQSGQIQRWLCERIRWNWHSILTKWIFGLKSSQVYIMVLEWHKWITDMDISIGKSWIYAMVKETYISTSQIAEKLWSVNSVLKFMALLLVSSFQ